MHWLDTERSDFDKRFVEGEARDARERWLRMVEWEKREEKNKEEQKEMRHLSVFYTGNLPRGVPEIDECGLAEIGNSKEETRGTQFRQVRTARCVIPYVLYAA
jgi:hypothetical protein